MVLRNSHVSYVDRTVWLGINIGQENMATRINLTPGQMNIVRPNLVGSANVLLPPLNIKSGLMKQRRTISMRQITSLSIAKKNEDVFVGSDI